MKNDPNIGFERTNLILLITVGILLAVSVYIFECHVCQDVYGQTKQSTNSGSQLESRIQDQVAETDNTPFYTENTKSTNTRVISISPTPMVEVTYNGNSSISESPTQTIGTIIDTMVEDGVIHSDGKAIILTATGQVITYRSESIGHYNPDGSFSDGGVVFFNMPFLEDNVNQTNPQNKSVNMLYSEFDNVIGIYKKTVDPSGNGLTKVWKWD